MTRRQDEGRNIYRCYYCKKRTVHYQQYYKVRALSEAFDGLFHHAIFDYFWQWGMQRPMFAERGPDGNRVMCLRCLAAAMRQADNLDRSSGRTPDAQIRTVNP